MNINLGASLNYEGLLVAVGVNNLTNPSTALVEGQSQRLPLRANATVGGFLDLGVLTFFPNAIAVYSPDEFFTKIGLDIHSQYVNLSAAYIADDLQQDISFTLASHYKKTFFGISYAQPLNEQDGIGDIRVFLNSSLFNSMNLFRSGFAEQIEKFY